MEIQDSTPLFENPAFTVSELQDRFEVVAKAFARLNSVPAPKPPPAPPAPVTKPDPANATGEADDASETPADSESSDSASEDAADSMSEQAHEELR